MGPTDITLSFMLNNIDINISFDQLNIGGIYAS
jgi:hypothetical protein